MTHKLPIGCNIELQCMDLTVAPKNPNELNCRWQQ